MFSYTNGKYVSTHQLSLPVVDDIIGTIRGYRIFTALRTIGKKIFHLDDHIDRLFNSARLIYMELYQTKDELKKIVEDTVNCNWEELLKQNKNRDWNVTKYGSNVSSSYDLLIEIIYSGGKAGPSGVAPSGKADLHIAVFPLKLPPEEWYEKGISLASYPYQRQWAEVKLLNYVGGVIAHQTVVKRFNADEALFLSPDDEIILEGTTFNFFIVQNKTIITHPLNGKILPGITRKIVLELTHKIDGVKTKEDYFTYNDLRKADEAFITSSTRNIVPVIKIDDIVIDNGQPAEITKRLSEEFCKYLKKY